MIRLKLQKNQSNFNIFVLDKKKRKTNMPNQIGINKKYKYTIINYYLIIILQKYGFSISKGLKKILLTQLLKG